MSREVSLKVKYTQGTSAYLYSAPHLRAGPDCPLLLCMAIIDISGVSLAGHRVGDRHTDLRPSLTDH